MSRQPVPFRVVVLGDSRVFDTYYATDAYAGRMYGYDKTFPHRLQLMLCARGGGGFDCVHIPDHFRGRTVQNNILRLALVDPDCVVLCDGIWESLVSRKHVAEYAEQTGDATAAEYSDALATRLFLADKLALSPAVYAARVGRIASWFTRRRRHVLWLTTPVPPRGYLGGLHYAGNYRPFEGWHECLAALNTAASTAVAACGGRVLDLQALMEAAGGAEAALIDQWHFSAAFHDTIATAIAAELATMTPVEEACASRRVIVQGAGRGVAFGLVGPAAARQRLAGALGASVSVEAGSASEAEARPDLVWINVEGDEQDREALSHRLASGPARLIVVYPEELASLDNPAVADRSAFGSFK